MAKKKKAHLPKRIAGVKVPKSVRKGRLGELLASPTGQALIAEAVVAAGAMGAARKAKNSPKVRHFMHDAGERVHHAGDRLHHGDARQEAGAMGATLAYALGEAARSFADALHGRDGGHEPDKDAGRASTQEDRSDQVRDTKKKREHSYEAGPL